MDITKLSTITSAECNATYDRIKTYVKKHTGLIVSSLNIAQVKRKYGLTTRDSYNKPTSDSSKRPKCPPEKENAILDALRHFKMI